MCCDFIFTTILTCCFSLYFSDILSYNNLPLDINFVISKNINLHGNLWIVIKNSFIPLSFIATYIFLFPITSFILPKNLTFLNFSKKEINTSSLNLLVGLNPQTNQQVYITEKGLFQNILVTGTIGTGKTSSAMYPFTKQLISYNSHNSNKKIGMLILDVKGNYYEKVIKYANEFGRSDDIIVIELNGCYKYNPLHKPDLKPIVLANRLKNILLLFSPNNTESYWLDESEKVLSEAIKLCRLYNKNYVTFSEIHKLITQETYYIEKVKSLHNLFLQNKFSKSEQYDLLSSINFFKEEFFSLDSRTLNILKSEITRITNCFVSDYEIQDIFCPKQKELNFSGFSDVISSGKIVVLNMNINQHRNLSKIIAAYLKLDFQSEVMSTLSNGGTPSRITSFISDEYSEYVTESDANFFSQSREAKCINIVSTQSYTSLLNTLNNQYSTKVIIQNLVNKLWFRTDDIFTIEDAQKQIGKIEKEKSSKTISENSKYTFYNHLTSTFSSKDSILSQSINTYSQLDFVYDTNFFTQNLETFSALSFLSDGSKILPPSKILLNPYFKK